MRMTLALVVALGAVGCDGGKIAETGPAADTDTDTDTDTDADTDADTDTDADADTDTDTDADTDTDTDPIDTTIDSQLCINEFMASNQEFLPGPYKDYPDWIEIHNPTDTEVNLQGYFITDDLKRWDRHELGDIAVPAGGFLLLYADDDEELGPEHLNFNLNASGEDLALFRRDGSAIDKITWTDQLQTDWSVARLPTDCSETLEHSDAPTPGESNAP